MHRWLKLRMPIAAIAISAIGAPVMAAAQDGATPVVSAETAPILAELVREISLGTDPSQAASGVAVGADGTLYVIDSLQDHIRVFDRDGHPLAILGTSGDGPGQFKLHEADAFWGDLAIGPDGNLYIVEPFNHRIQVLAPDGTFLRQWGEFGDQEGQFERPSGIGFDAEGRVYVTEFGQPRLQIFDAEGLVLAAWDLAAVDGVPLEGAIDVAVDPAGIASITDTRRSQVFRVDAQGHGVDAFDGSDGPAGQLRNPMGVALDALGNLYVADYNGSRIQVFAPDGRSLGSTGEIGREPGQFITPIFLTIGPDGFLYVAEEGNRRIQVFRLLSSPGSAQGTPVRP